MLKINPAQNAEEIKSCCATLYESDWAKLLLGDSFHPGGLALTRRLGEMLKLQPGQRVLDIAAGQGNSAIFLAQHFGCQVVGIDYGRNSIAQAEARAGEAGVSDLVRFEYGDAEQLPVAEATFDAVFCECAFCTFPHKTAAASEFARVLKPGGQLALSDLTRQGELPAALDTLLAWISCIADARPQEEYTNLIQHVGLTIKQVESYPQALAEMVKAVQGKLLGAEIMVKLKKLELPSSIDFEQAKSLAKHTAIAVKAGNLGYILITAEKRA